MKKERYAQDELRQMASFFLRELMQRPAALPLERLGEGVFNAGGGKSKALGLDFAGDGLDLARLPVAWGEENAPRLSRREFSGGRSARRAGRDLSLTRKLEGGDALESGFGENETLNVREGQELPQKLSDFYCRDARRYDGGFERY